jgi:hypothetical protein
MQNATLTVKLELEADAIEHLFELEFEGWCPICKDVCINEGETICCNCLTIALGYHVNMCGCRTGEAERSQRKGGGDVEVS